MSEVCSLQFFYIKMLQDYYVADASEGQVMLCVVHNTSDTNLYISDVQGRRFSLSLERIVYFSPKGANKDTWLRSALHR